jgi:hypothetical protein
MRPGNPNDAMTVFEEREAWADLTGRYRFTYGMSLQARIATQGLDIQNWWRIGGQLETWPEKVRDIIIEVAQETQVRVRHILGDRQLPQIVEARHEVVRRLAAMPWRGGWRESGHPSPQQIARWMNMERSTVARILSKQADVRGG